MDSPREDYGASTRCKPNGKTRRPGETTTTKNRYVIYSVQTGRHDKSSDFNIFFANPNDVGSQVPVSQFLDVIAHDTKE